MAANREETHIPVVMARRGNGHLAVPSGPAPRPMGPPPTGTSESLIGVAWRGRWTLLLSVVLAIAGGFAYIQVVTPVYTSTARVYLEYSSLPSLGSNESGRIPQTERYLSTQADVMVSRRILDRALTSDMRQYRTFTRINDHVGYLRRKLRVTVGRREDVIRLSFDSPYPIDASNIVNAVVDAYLDSASEKTTVSASELLAGLEKTRDADTARLEAKRQELEKFRADANLPVLGLTEQVSGILQTALEYERARAQLEIEADDAREFLSRIQKLQSDPTGLRSYLAPQGLLATYEGGGTSEKTLLLAELAAARQQHDRILAELTPHHPRVVALEATIERINAKLQDVDDRFVRGVLAGAQQQYEEVQQRLAAADQRCRKQNRLVESYNRKLSEYQTRHREVDSLALNVEAVRDDIERISTFVEGGDEANQMRIRRLEDAVPGREPSSPQKGRVMAIALFLGLLSGGGCTVLRDLLDQKLRSAEEISASLGLPILGVVPTISRRVKISARGQYVHVQSDSPEAEAFRTVRTAILFGAPKERARTMLVTSPAQGDGKSTLASNLAIAMAQAGQKTILLDADFRRPVQHTIFEIEADENGLSAVLAGRQSLAEARHRTRIEGLEMIPAGLKVPNPAEILNSPRFGALLKRLSEHYDRIIVDAPPVTVVTDAQIIGAICGITVLVLRADKSTKKLGERAIDALHRVGANLIGAVVNDVRRNGDRYGYYGSYGGLDGSGRTGRRPEKARGDRDKNRPRSPMEPTLKGGSLRDREV